MDNFYLCPAQPASWRVPRLPTSLVVQLWLGRLAPAVQLRVLAARPGPIEVAVYDSTGRVLYQATTHPNSTLTLEMTCWPAGTYAVRASQGTHRLTRLLLHK